jgi:hypothetical protein
MSRPAGSIASAGPSAGPSAECDVGLLYVGCSDSVHVFDLARGERSRLEMDREGRESRVTGLAIREDGARLFAVIAGGVFMWDTRTRIRTALGPTGRPSTVRGRSGHGRSQDQR